MLSSVVYEAYAPVFYEDDKFIPQVTALVREYYDKDESKAAVVSRLDGRLISAVSNSAIVFDDPRYYAGRLIAPNSSHNRTKIARIHSSIRKAGLLDKYSGGIFGLKLDSVQATEIESTTGRKKTLIVAEQSQILGSDDGSELREYINEVVGAVNNGIQNRASLEPYEFNSLSNLIPIVSLGSLAVGSEESLRRLTNNINELVSNPLLATVIIEDGLTTTQKLVG